MSQYGLTVSHSYLPTATFLISHFFLKSVKCRNLGSLPSADDRHSRRSCVIVHAISNPIRDASGRASTVYGSECGPVAGSSNQIRNDPVMLGDLCQLLSLASLHHFESMPPSPPSIASYSRARPVVALVDPLGSSRGHYSAL